MAENLGEELPALTYSEHVRQSVFSLMRDNYRPSPKELWGLSHSADLLTPRRFVVDSEESYAS